MDSPELHATEGPGNEVKGDHQPEHDTESEAFLSRTWRQAREDEMLILRDTGGHPTHPRACSPAPLDRLILWHRQCWLRALESYTANSALAKPSRSAEWVIVAARSDQPLMDFWP